MRTYPFGLAVLLFVQSAALAAKPAPLPESTPWNVKRLSKAPQVEWLDQKSKVHSLQYTGEAYRGKPTEVFAYYASPATLGAAGKDQKFPGIVLVHGGGGAAFSNWAQLWARRGYAAIAMDLAGKGAGRKRLDRGGPDQSDAVKFGQIDAPIKDQWTYHAVSNVILAHSLLLEMDSVDRRRTALTGISWGGYLTCIVAGLDQRFKVAMPVYGCGFLKDNSYWVGPQFGKMKPAQREKWHNLWDPSRYIGSATMPLVFLNGTNDFAYPMDSYAKTCALVQGEKNYSIQLRMRHGHIFDFPEFFLFVDQYIKGTAKMPVVARPTIKGGRVTATVTSPTKIISARLHYTTGPHQQNGRRAWVSKPLQVDGEKIYGPAPPRAATVWYVDVRNAQKALVSSQIMVK